MEVENGSPIIDRSRKEREESKSEEQWKKV